MGFPLSPACLESVLSTGPVARCSWGCLHTHHQRTFLIVGVVSLPNYCRCPRSALPARCRKPRAPPWLPRTAAMAPFRLPTPTLIPSSLNQQETAGLARFSPAHLSFLDSCPHCDASGSRRPDVWSLTRDLVLPPAMGRRGPVTAYPASPLFLHPLANSRGLASLQPLADRPARWTFTFKQSWLYDMKN